MLFIGNSLTEANDLPAIVAALSGAAGAPITTRAVVFGGYDLGDHWRKGDAVRAIAEGGWAVVVLQQGPSALPESQVALRTWTARFDQNIRAVGARTALYMVWPESVRRDAFDDVSASYTHAADDVHAMLFPVGEAWLAAWRRDPSVPLYGPDGFHPTQTATYLAALVVCQGITGRSPLGLPAFVPLVAERTRSLQEAAAEANERFGRQ